MVYEVTLLLNALVLGASPWNYFKCNVPKKIFGSKGDI
jgi:hypothetical protein